MRVDDGLRFHVFIVMRMVTLAQSTRRVNRAGESILTLSAGDAESAIRE
jgi:hypothetical protein